MVADRMETTWIGLFVLALIGGLVAGVQAQELSLPYSDWAYNVIGPAFDITNKHFPWIWPPVVYDPPWATPEMYGIRGQYKYVGLVYTRNPNIGVPISPDIIVDPNGFVRTAEIVVDPNGIVVTPGITSWGYTNAGILGGEDFGVAGIAEDGDGVYGKGGSGDYGGRFDGGIFVDGKAVLDGDVKVDGDVEVDGHLFLSTGFDYAEGFDVSGDHQIGPGTVLVIDSQSPGKLTVTDVPYDTRVAGIVAGAKGLGSGVCLGGGQFDHDVALAGRVYCNVDATRTAVKPGDLLTTAGVPGYAMKVMDHRRARGAILGKAMEGLEKGQRRQILVLVTLQ